MACGSPPPFPHARTPGTLDHMAGPTNFAKFKTWAHRTLLCGLAGLILGTLIGAIYGSTQVDQSSVYSTQAFQDAKRQWEVQTAAKVDEARARLEQQRAEEARRCPQMVFRLRDCSPSASPATSLINSMSPNERREHFKTKYDRARLGWELSEAARIENAGCPGCEYETGDGATAGAIMGPLQALHSQHSSQPGS